MKMAMEQITGGKNNEKLPLVKMQLTEKLLVGLKAVSKVLKD